MSCEEGAIVCFKNCFSILYLKTILPANHAKLRKNKAIFIYGYGGMSRFIAQCAARQNIFWYSGTRYVH